MAILTICALLRITPTPEVTIATRMIADRARLDRSSDRIDSDGHRSPRLSHTT
jgi:hypothetical protein